MLPYLTARAPWFTFLVHPRDPSDLMLAGVGSVLREYSEGEEDFQRKSCSLPPLVVGEVAVGSNAVRGELVVAMCLPRDIMSRAGQRAVIAAAQMSAQRGTRVLGLGALASPATGGGALLLDELPPSVTVTNGNAYTAAVAKHNVVEACAILQHTPPTCRVAVVGCTGSVGVATSKLLADAGFDLLLVGRSASRARTLLGSLADRATFAGDLAAVRGAEIVLLLTSDPSAKLVPEMVSAGAIVIDVAQPLNIAPEHRGAFRRRGIDVVQGGIVEIPGYRCSYEMNMPARGAFACMAETYLFAREGIREHSVGRPGAEFALHLERLARKHGVAPMALDITRPQGLAPQLVAAGS